jgi:hypothetical protein
MNDKAPFPLPRKKEFEQKSISGILYLEDVEDFAVRLGLA